MGNKSHLSFFRFSLIFLNFLILVIGTGFIATGAYLNGEKSKDIPEISYLSSETEVMLSTLMLEVGAAITIFGFTGWYGAVAGSRLLLSLYFGILLAFFVFGLVVLGIGISKKSKVSDFISNSTNDIFINYFNDTEDAGIVDKIQEHFKCCGTVNNKTPWTVLEKTPDSCYKVNSTELFTTGCDSAVTQILPHALWTIAAIEAVEAATIICSLKVISRL